MKIEVGTKIRWTSRAGVLEGVVKSIKLDLNAAKEVCPWFVVEKVTDYMDKPLGNVQLNGNHGYLKMMKVEVVQ